MARAKASNTSNKQGKRGNPDIVEAGKATQLKKGYDPRRNLKGRPKSFDQWRALAQDIAEQIATKQDGTPLMWNGQEITVAELILLSWAGDKKNMEKFVEAAFGKVPQPVEHAGKDGEPIKIVVEYASD